MFVFALRHQWLLWKRFVCWPRFNRKPKLFLSILLPSRIQRRRFDRYRLFLRIAGDYGRRFGVFRRSVYGGILGVLIFRRSVSGDLLVILLGNIFWRVLEPHATGTSDQ